MDNRFTDIIQLIKQSRTNAIKAVNAELINLYWNIGEHISKKIEQSEWGDSVVTELANFIQTQEPEIKGFSDKNIWRMKQFYETYKEFPKLSTLLREISWSHNLAIFSRCKTVEEREFYLKLAKQDNNPPNINLDIFNSKEYIRVTDNSQNPIIELIVAVIPTKQ